MGLFLNYIAKIRKDLEIKKIFKKKSAKNLADFHLYKSLEF